MALKNSGFIGVHVGAGNHSKSKFPEYKKVCKMACRKAMEAIKSKKTAIEAVAIAIQILEDSPLTNAGFGSNLTQCGTVECDASIMDGLSRNFGAVAAVKGIANPILIAKKLVEDQGTAASDGRVKPMLLCGEGAHSWAVEHGVTSVSEHALISENALTSFKKYSKRKIAQRNKTTHHDDHNGLRKKLKTDDNEGEVDLPPSSSARIDHATLDTVGAVCLDRHGNVCSGVSSGGLLLKCPGRIGQAAVYGAGCWSSNSTEGNPVSMACSSSGCGEQLIKTLLCKECAELSRDRDGITTMQQLLQDRFLGSSSLPEFDEKLAGVILLQCRRGEDCAEDDARTDEMNIEFTWGHTTQTMAVAFMNSDDSKPQFHLTSLAPNCSPGRSMLVQGVIKHD